MKFLNNYSIVILLLINFRIIGLTNPIRTKLIFTKVNEPHWLDFKKLAPWLAKNGLIFVEENPDVILCDENAVAFQKKRKVPIIVMERRDSAAVSSKVAQWLEYDHVKAVFKNYTLNPVELNNKPRCADIYHFKFVNDQAKLVEEHTLHLSHKALQKIRCVPWCIVNSFLGNSVPWAMWTHNPGNYTYGDLKKEQIKFNFPRPIDVSFIGTTEFYLNNPQSSKLYTYHREKTVSKIAAMQGLKRMIITGKRILPFEDYIKQMKRTKIVISPWGYGEWCWRDFEAMLAGAVVIKPWSDFIKTVPNIYQAGVTYVACKPDLSDLEEKVKYVLEHYSEFKQMRINARKLLLEHDSLDEMARYFVKNVKEIIAEG